MSRRTVAYQCHHDWRRRIYASGGCSAQGQGQRFQRVLLKGTVDLDMPNDTFVLLDKISGQLQFVADAWAVELETCGQLAYNRAKVCRKSLVLPPALGNHALLTVARGRTTPLLLIKHVRLPGSTFGPRA